MIRRSSFACAAAAVLAITTPAAPQDAPVPSERTRAIEALVERAAALVEQRGRAAFTEFATPDSEWWFGETYLFAYDENLNVLLNPAFPARVGTNPSGETDATGKAFHDEFLRVVRAHGAGWVGYMFPKPGQTRPSQKWSYVRAVTVDGMPGIIGAGFYPQSPP